LATNADDKNFSVALDALVTPGNTGQNGVGHAVSGILNPLSRR